MASAPVTTGAPSRASSNVVRLPTASTRKVQQHFNRAARAAKAELPRHPAEHLWAGQRLALRRAKRMVEITHTPALMIACAIYRGMDDDARKRVLLSLAPGLVDDTGIFRDAVEMLLTTTMTVGEQVDLDWAFARLAGAR